MAEPLARVESGGDATLAIVRIVGEVDLSNVDAIAKQVEAGMTGDAPRAVLDLTRTTYFDSAGVRMLFTMAATARERGWEMIVVAPTSGVVRRILDLTDVASVCPVYPSIADIPSA